MIDRAQLRRLADDERPHTKLVRVHALRWRTLPEAVPAIWCFWDQAALAAWVAIDARIRNEGRYRIESGELDD